MLDIIAPLAATIIALIFAISYYSTHNNFYRIEAESYKRHNSELTTQIEQLEEDNRRLNRQNDYLNDEYAKLKGLKRRESYQNLN